MLRPSTSTRARRPNVRSPTPADRRGLSALVASPRRILILGASYGSLLATKILVAGQNVSLVCRADEADLINSEGTRVHIPLRGRDAIEIDSRTLPGRLDAMTPDAADPSQYDLVVLAMQEPHYRSAQVRELLDRIANSLRPVMSIMNMPPLPFLARIPGLDPSPWSFATRTQGSGMVSNQGFSRLPAPIHRRFGLPEVRPIFFTLPLRRTSRWPALTMPPTLQYCGNSDRPLKHRALILAMARHHGCR